MRWRNVYCNPSLRCRLVLSRQLQSHGGAVMMMGFDALALRVFLSQWWFRGQPRMCCGSESMNNGNVGL